VYRDGLREWNSSGQAPGASVILREIDADRGRRENKWLAVGAPCAGEGGDRPAQVDVNASPWRAHHGGVPVGGCVGWIRTSALSAIAAVLTLVSSAASTTGNGSTSPEVQGSTHSRRTTS